MATPDVSQNLLAELEDMGFPHAKAIKALHFSGNSGIEDAINWIIEHEDDADIDDIPSVTVDIPIEEPSDSSDISGSVETNLQQLRDQARKNQEEEHKKLERDREKERINSGKELLKAKQMAEENERKRYIESYEADKEERKRAMERIRQKLQQDKAERRRRLAGEDGVSAEPESSSLPEKIESATVVDHGSVPVNYTRKRAGDPMRDCLRSLKRQHLDDDAQVKRAFQTLLIYVKNVANHPEEEKFRKIRLTNPAFRNKVGRYKDGVEFLELCGFEKHGEFLILPREKVDLAILKEAWDALHSALTNPFFGLLSRNAVVQTRTNGDLD